MSFDIKGTSRYKNKQGGEPRKYVYKSQEAIDNKGIALRENFMLFRFKGMLTVLSRIDDRLVPDLYRDKMIESINHAICYIQQVQRDRKLKRDALKVSKGKLDRRTRKYKESIKDS